MRYAILRKVFAVVAPAAVVVGLGAAIAAQNNGGAIFVSTRDGGVPDVFDTSLDPFLNAGPRGNRKCSASGLTDGDYYFQVTDPPGRSLLSSDDLEHRRITVIGGRVVDASATHGQWDGWCGNLVVQLFPFVATPNADLDYKVWMTPVSRHDAWGGGSFGFLPRFSKTHNFKVALETGPVEVDSDGDGIIDFYDHCPFFYDPANTCYSG